MVPYTAIYDRTLDLADFVTMNEIITCNNENEHRAYEAQKREAESKKR